MATTNLNLDNVASDSHLNAFPAVFNANMQKIDTAFGVLSSQQQASAAAAIAPDYADLTFPVASGTWCWYNGSLNRAKVDIPASETWTAAHWETAPLSNALAGDVASLKSIIQNEVFDGYNLYQGKQMVRGYAVRASDGTINVNSGYDCTDFIDIERCSRIVYTRPVSTAAQPSVGIAFYDSSKQYISGLANKGNGASAGVTVLAYTVPTGAKYARFSWWNESNIADYGIDMPFFVYDFADYIKVYAGNIKTNILALNYAEFTEIVTGKGISYLDGSESVTTAYDRTGYINVESFDKITYTRPCITGNTSTLGMAFYDSSHNFISGSGIQNKINADKTGYEMYTCDVPTGAVYARFSWWNDTYSATYGITQKFAVYDAADYVGSLQDDVEALKSNQAGGDAYNELGLHTIPQSVGVLNAIKRCRQMTEFEWTPAVDLPRAMMVTLTPPDAGPQEVYEGVFKAGVKYKGLPYGNCVGYKPAYGYNNTYIGTTVSFDSFATSVANAESMLCKESQHSLSPHRALVYATVCSSLVCYAINVPFVETGSIPSISGMSSVGKIINNGVRMDIDNTLRLGDLLNKVNVHVSMITDIIRNQSGQIEYIEISEATVIGNGNQSVNGGPLGGVCRRLAFTVEDFFWRYGTYTLLRYGNINSVPYTKSPWVDVGNEIPMNPMPNLPCMPYEGDGFAYLSGHIPSTKILISCHDYDYLRVFKDGTELENSPFAVGPTDDYISVGFSDVGNYSAYLCNMSGGADTAMTARCHWSVAADNS